jgi:hypothetical protein
VIRAARGRRARRRRHRVPRPGRAGACSLCLSRRRDQTRSPCARARALLELFREVLPSTTSRSMSSATASRAPASAMCARGGFHGSTGAHGHHDRLDRPGEGERGARPHRQRGRRPSARAASSPRVFERPPGSLLSAKGWDALRPRARRRPGPPEGREARARRGARRSASTGTAPRARAGVKQVVMRHEVGDTTAPPCVPVLSGLSPRSAPRSMVLDSRRAHQRHSRGANTTPVDRDAARLRRRADSPEPKAKCSEQMSPQSQASAALRTEARPRSALSVVGRGADVVAALAYVGALRSR